MERREFIKKTLGFGVGIFLLPEILFSCAEKELDVLDKVKFKGNVIIIGAGTAGLVAGYFLKKNGIDFQIIEASSRFGGRVKKIEIFSDFPIDLGAEWIHTEPSTLSELLEKPEIDIKKGLIEYNPQIHQWDGKKLKSRSALSYFYSEYKFKNSTWYDYLEKYLVPSSSDRIVYNSPVNEIDYSADKVIVKNTKNQVFKADAVIITVPISILKDESITFIPSLPSEKIEALNRVEMPAGIKIFVEFSEKFYPDLIFHDSKALTTGNNYKTFYDAAFKKGSTKNILGVFSTGNPASIYSNLKTDKEIIDKVINELDLIFKGKASKTYKKHIIQNWTREPYTKGSYSKYLKSEDKTIKALVKPLKKKVYFAGEALNLDGETATVHGAGQSGYSTVREILKG